MRGDTCTGDRGHLPYPDSSMGGGGILRRFVSSKIDQRTADPAIYRKSCPDDGNDNFQDFRWKGHLPLRLYGQGIVLGLGLGG